MYTVCELGKYCIRQSLLDDSRRLPTDNEQPRRISDMVSTSQVDVVFSITRNAVLVLDDQHSTQIQFTSSLQYTVGRSIMVRNRAQLNNDEFNGDVFEAQKRLRKNLLDKQSIRDASSRDLAALMLLNLDDLTRCWSIATDWLRAELNCHRVDTGFGTADSSIYHPSFSESRSPDSDVPSFSGSNVFNQDPMMKKMWSAKRPLVLENVENDSTISPRMRIILRDVQTKSKFAFALKQRNKPYGLICADWTEHVAPQNGVLYECFEHAVTDVFSPIIGVAKQISDATFEKCSEQSQPTETIGWIESPLKQLTKTETEVARLVAQGLSYKEIARVRGRSFSTIDHQLRSIRKKLNVSSTAELVSQLAKNV